jgi:hypothetical protein
MLNGQLKPGYNWQISTQNQYILDYTIHQDLADTSTLPAHVGSLVETLGDIPEALVADAGYGSEQNYEYLESRGIEVFVKYNNFHKEQQKLPQIYASGLRKSTNRSWIALIGP